MDYTMRKIEQQMNTAIQANESFAKANTAVVTEGTESKVYLHGNHIATVGDNYLEIFDGGWQSNTTKSRLNALIDCFCDAVTDGVYQKNFEWFVRDAGVVHPFGDGYRFA